MNLDAATLEQLVSGCSQAVENVLRLLRQRIETRQFLLEENNPKAQDPLLLRPTLKQRNFRRMIIPAVKPSRQICYGNNVQVPYENSDLVSFPQTAHEEFDCAGGRLQSDRNALRNSAPCNPMMVMNLQPSDDDYKVGRDFSLTGLESAPAEQTRVRRITGSVCDKMVSHYEVKYEGRGSCVLRAHN